MKVRTLTLILIFLSVTSFGQTKTDAESIFKMFLFLNKENVSFKGMDQGTIKNDSLYKVFSDIFYLKLDILRIIKVDFNDQIFVPKFKFYELIVFDSAKKSLTNNVITKRDLRNDEGQFMGVYIGGCDNYVIGINQSTGASYRLKGFQINDFLSFLSDFKEAYNSRSRKRLNTKSFLNGYQIDGLDFECLYNGLTAKEIDRKKYPCLARTADIYPVH